MRFKGIIRSSVLFVALIMHVYSFGQANDLLLYLNFDDTKEIPMLKTSTDKALSDHCFTTEIISGENWKIFGLAKYVPGVKNSAIKLDGYSSWIEGKLNKLSEEALRDNISVEAWISLGAYPWNRAPVIAAGRQGITGFFFGIDSKGRLGFHVSDGTATWHECNSGINTETKAGLDLNKWYHVVGTYSSQSGLAVYINGELSATYREFLHPRRIMYSEPDKGFVVGKNRIDLAPSDPVREWATFPSRYTLDGIVDELKIYGKALTAGEVQTLYKSVKPENDPGFLPRKFPVVKPSGRFDANYTRLRYYQEWDDLWPPGDHLDVVVQFDEYPTRLMFWRGTRYSACWVSENGKWLADQSRETGSNWFLSQGSSDALPTGCIEHMSDTQCRSSRVAIIENNDARKVVNWRYLQMDVNFRQVDLDNQTGFGQWGNENYYIYPDGMCIRHVLPGFGGWQETIFLNEPGTRPEDNVETEACTLYNMEGESKSYSWESGYPKFDLEKSNIQLINLKSRFKPFIIFREKGSFKVFNGEVRPEYSRFPWWNHWPVAQVRSDGRYASYPDQAAHSSLSWGNPAGEAAIYGMTDQPDNVVVDLARSWNHPPEMHPELAGFESKGYDYRQRAYILNTLNQGAKLNLTFDASEKSPLFNPVLIINNWNGSDVRLMVDNREVPRGKDFRYGVEYDVEGNMTLVAWIKIRATAKTNISLIPTE